MILQILNEIKREVNQKEPVSIRSVVHHIQVFLPEAYPLAKEMETECRNLLHEITRLEEALAQDLARRKEKPV